MDKRSSVAKIKKFKAGKKKDAELFILESVFMLASGSIICRPIESSKDWADQGRFYQRYNSIFDSILNDGKSLLISEREARLITDVAFKSPSAAASICSGYSENGYEFWKGLKLFKTINEKEKENIL
ncbi:MAG: DUF4357 domain-containing protein [Erysipelothrix sp.]|nr:DUF4357 domain-containing protein [Erysipelothrix sp.]